jgi:hypothetical protein
MSCGLILKMKRCYKGRTKCSSNLRGEGGTDLVLPPEG